MGPCATCGQLTEPEVDYCPACSGYAAPATIYSYAPNRISHADDSLEQILMPLPPAHPPPQDVQLIPLHARPGPTPEQIPASTGGELSAGDLAARLRARSGGRREGRWLVLSAMLIVLIIAAGAVLLEVGHPGPASAAHHKPAIRTSTAAPSPTAPPAPGPQVSVAPQAASSPYAATVLSFLTSYFAAINAHDFAAYEQLFSPPLRADLSAPAFSAGYETTTDSAITLTNIEIIGSGELVGQVTFVSHQQPAASPTSSACTSWSVSLYLLQQGGSYMLQQPPAGYQASYTACS